MKTEKDANLTMAASRLLCADHLLPRHFPLPENRKLV